MFIIQIILKIIEVEVVNSTVGTPFIYQWYDENMDQMAGETNSIIEDFVWNHGILLLQLMQIIVRF